ncbi:MAG: hypothetical protein K9K64_03870 [Desulfohalobiaceae bacterium]|nr:hypothetical protein [Desulfohalobiaceae bacterium]
MDSRRVKRRPLFVLIGLLIGLSLTGCGNKKWPTVVTEEDTFSFERVTAGREAGCLNLEASLSGAVDNLRTIVLELASQDDSCPKCPFQPMERFYLKLSDPQIKREGSTIWISHCGLGLDTSYRIRLAGLNEFAGIKVSLSEVVRVP